VGDLAGYTTQSRAIGTARTPTSRDYHIEVMIFGIADNFFGGIPIRHRRFDMFDSFLFRFIFCCNEDLISKLPCVVNVWLPIDLRLH